MIAAQVRVLDGRPVVVINGEYGELLDKLLARALKAAYATGTPLLPWAEEVANAARVAFSLHSCGIVPVEGHSRDGDGADTTEWITTAQAADRLGITHDAMRKRVSRGVVRSNLVAGRRLVRLDEIGADRCR